MIGKAKFFVGLGIGYVLGTRSGQERYGQMKSKAQEMWRNPRVQEQADHAQTVIKEKAGDVGSTVASKVSSKKGNGSGNTSSPASDPSTPTPRAPGANAPSALDDQPPGTLS
jgi:hypothetical protein